jgi:DNA invertase Pin-like site-specific DNA recombinase
MNVGYARVSTGELKMDLQLDALEETPWKRRLGRDALEEVGCETIYADELSGAKSDRPGLKEAIDDVRPGDTLVVWRLDRFGRSLKDLVTKVERLREKDVGFKSLKENIDTTSGASKLQFHIFSALAEFERDLNREHTMTGLRAARERGRVGGPARRVLDRSLGGGPRAGERRVPDLPASGRPGGDPAPDRREVTTRRGAYTGASAQLVAQSRSEAACLRPGPCAADRLQRDESIAPLFNESKIMTEQKKKYAKAQQEKQATERKVFEAPRLHREAELTEVTTERTFTFAVAS